MLLLICSLMINTQVVIAQNVQKESTQKEVIQPTFSGGPLQASVFIGKNFKYPKDAKTIKGTVVLEFFVEEDGSITEVTVAESLLKSLDDEVVRVVKMMPKWTPGTENGKVVRMSHKMPVTFAQQESIKVQDEKGNKCDGKYIKVEKE